jgi:hypothetical protein
MPSDLPALFKKLQDLVYVDPFYADKNDIHYANNLSLKYDAETKEWEVHFFHHKTDWVRCYGKTVRAAVKKAIKEF